MDTSQLPIGDTLATVIYKESCDNIIVQLADGRRMEVSCAATYIKVDMQITLIVDTNGFWVSYRESDKDVRRAAT